MKKFLATFMLATLMATTALPVQVAAATKVKVTYVENGGKTVKDQSLNKNSNPKEPSITKSGYKFMGWYTNKGLTKKWDTKSAKVTKNTTLYAKWAKAYTVKYITNNGKDGSSQTVGSGTNPTEPKVTRSGYTFEGWYTDNKLTKKWNASSGKITKNTTLYAKWTKKNAQTPEQEMLSIINAERKKVGSPALVLDTELTKAAYTKSKDMADNNILSNDSPTYGTFYDLMDAFNITYEYIAANIARGYTSPSVVMEAWMNSASNRDSILDPDFTKVGLGVYKKDGVTYWTQIFIY